MSYFVYVIQSDTKAGIFYAGLTDNIERRLSEHNRGKSKFTSAYIPWRLIHTESFESREAARVREKYFKTGAGRRFIKKLLETQNS